MLPRPPSLPHPLAAWREEFAVFRHGTYLNTCSLGALSRASRARVTRHLDEWDERGAANWYDGWWAMLDELRQRYARLVGGTAAAIALHPSVSSILGVVAGTLDHARRPRVVTTELDFPTVPYQWLARDVEVVLLPSDDGITVAPDRFAAAIDDRTALVATSHVHFRSGAIQDVAALADIARRHGALTFIDGYQAVGQLPVDVVDLGVDFYCAGGLKWLLGGSGVCFLWANPDTTGSLHSRTTGWFGHRDQFRFDPAEFAPHDDARRFETGTPPLLPICTQLGGLDVLDAAGPQAIRAVTSALTEDLIAQARERGLVPAVASRPLERSGIVMLPHDDPAAAVARLAARGYIVDARPGHVRVSPYFYNVAEDHRGLLEALLDGR
jgi:selenocysteine lyase/cysteine desulfurase